MLSEDNWEISAREGLLGLGKAAEARLGRMADGDRVWVYVNRKHVDHQIPHVYEIRAVAKIEGPTRRLMKSPWKARGDQHFEFARPIQIERRLALPARDLLMTLSFAGRPPFWGMKLMNAPLKLTTGDVEKLEKAAGQG